MNDRPMHRRTGLIAIIQIGRVALKRQILEHIHTLHIHIWNIAIVLWYSMEPLMHINCHEALCEGICSSTGRLRLP